MGLTRRGFLATAGAAAVGCSRGSQGPGREPAPEPDRAGPPDREWTLDVGWLETTLAGTRVRLRAYNGQIPGPPLVMKPGETIAITVRNHLTRYDSSAWGHDMNVPHKLDTTNLHLHGLEIVPHLFVDPEYKDEKIVPLGTSNPSAPMIAIGPQEERTYIFKIPDDQPPGFFWYHPHHHGSTVVQAVSGMAGGIIVVGDVDEVPEIKAARDIPLVVQDIGLFRSDDSSDPPDLWTYEPRQNAIWNTTDGKVHLPGVSGRPVPLHGGFSTGDYALRYFLINGEPFFKEVHNDAKDQSTKPIGTQLDVPRYSLRPGEVVRFRMLNGNSDNLMPIIVEGHDMHLIALDGVNFPSPRTIEPPKIQKTYGSDVRPQLLLASANRAEFLIKARPLPAPAPGEPPPRRAVYRIVQLAQSQQFLDSEQKTLAEIVVEGDSRDMALPKRLPEPSRHYPLIKDHEIQKVRTVVFSARFPAQKNKMIGLDLMINGELYQEDSVGEEWKTAIGAVEEWHLSVPDEGHGGNEGHPFHIHVNSFEVHSIGGVRQPPGTIQDTIWVHKDSEVVIRTKFRQWSGKSVFHCHILPHEDTGMMKNMLIRG